ncbi:META domain-containing protein [Hymenobacter pini]|uniref:META domain-containing protein n=1 Tax=Hymenobacter pini TaxID=2880879 RepID=UPI001CF27092|nr:META domain-containing protein [Hymenobacter pini]MCA8832442.1 META domain-containing protein [Hymenobacter pini]
MPLSLPTYTRVATFLGLLATTACNYDLNERPAGQAPSAAASRMPAVLPLRNVRWELRELAGQPAPATQETPFLVLRDNRTRAEGQAGCNKFSGPYTMAADNRLRLGPLVTTRSACANLAAEGAFLQALNQAQRYHFKVVRSACTRPIPRVRLWPGLRLWRRNRKLPWPARRTAGPGEQNVY